MTFSLRLSPSTEYYTHLIVFQLPIGKTTLMRQVSYKMAKLYMSHFGKKLLILTVDLFLIPFTNKLKKFDITITSLKQKIEYIEIKYIFSHPILDLLQTGKDLKKN